MAYLLGCENVHLEYPTKKVFDSVTLGIDEGDRIGIVGGNGDGKSTLLALLAGSVEPDDGRIMRRGGTTIRTLEQADALDQEATVAHTVVGDAPEYTWASDPRIRNIIRGLIADIDWESLIGELSGGQRRRVDLARVLIADCDVLMLDEPTNHLDMHGIAWLADHLKNRWPKKSGALLVVTHDRWFLDEVCLGMWEVHGGQVEQFDGGYSAYILQRVERAEAASTAEQKRKNLMRKELAWLSRGARARSTKPKFHIEAARALIADEPPVRNSLELKRTAISRLGKQVVDLVDVAESFGDNTVIDNVTWLIGPGDRFGILGENGSGKTTLLNVILGSLEPTSGHVKTGKTVKFAVLSQHLDELSELGSSRVREVLSRYSTRYEFDGKELTPAQLLERLGFSAAQLSAVVSSLSGGEKRRLQLMLILLDKPNVLILDEPDNDLDIDMLAVVESLLDTWPGTLLLITHDRHLMERVTDDQFALVDGKVRHVPGGIDEYLRLLDERRDANAEAKPEKQKPKEGAA
ncbi:MAG: ABC-F family ATP-binding cassette domain-containing protein, partial [Coriobacteriia bacterium]|nr:ABC-F family ATP-binding cassette domain-containing protein [Coriobacteriia bacterium]